MGSLQPVNSPEAKPKLGGVIEASQFGPESMDPMFGIENADELDDESLVQEYLESRCTQAFEKIVRRYERELYTFLRRFLGDAQSAEDVFQATFLSVHLRVEQFERGRRFRPWLYAIASNKAIDFMRRNKRHQIGSLNAPAPASEKEEALIHKLPGHEETPDTLAVSRETSGRVRMALQQLNEPTQELLQLAFYQGMKYADIAEMLHIPLGTVKSRVFTAIRKLNAIWMRMEENKENNQE
ncbi:MAG: RNA polymerase sigma factor [bacterium]